MHKQFGKYVLLEKLATGGMAEIYLAKTPSIGGISKFVAIKRILPQFSDNPEFIDMFKDEAKIAINLNHSNIVSIYEFGIEKKQFFLVMDYVEGRNLRQILNKVKKTSQQLTTEQILYIIKETASGLDNAHRCLDGSTGRPLNITHRDISPQNVMISFEGEVKIVDFGIAKAESQLETTRAGTLKGKFGYMSPEQAEGLTADLRTDIFSLGIILWELLANDRLFVANNEINTLRKIRDCQIPSLRKINPNIPQELDRIVNKALARDRNLRYQTAAAFQKDLNKFLNRQYPDFSPHDFSVFVKTLFANEILENRKRLIEYSKVPFNNQEQGAAENSDDLTSTMTETDSETDSLSERPTKTRRISPLTNRRIQAPSNFVDAAKENRAKSNISFESLKVSRSEMVKKTLELKETNQQPLPTEDDSELADSGSLSMPRPAITSIANADTGSHLNNTNTNYSMVTDYTGKTYRSNLKRNLALSFIACLIGIYFFRPAVIQDASHFLSTDFAGETVNQTTSASTEVIEDKISEFNLYVTSEPVQGASIFIDGKNTGKRTPSFVPIPRNKAFSLDVKIDGYETYSRRFKTDKNSQRAKVKLEVKLVGYLSIDVTPPNSRTLIYVNGEKLAQGPPIKKYQVNAGQRITVKAVNPYNQAEAQQLVVVDKDKLKKVTLRLKNRKPSNQRTRKRRK